MGWRWRAPGGEVGRLAATEAAAVADAIMRSARFKVADLHPKETELLWRSLSRAGWRVEEAPA